MKFTTKKIIAKLKKNTLTSLAMSVYQKILIGFGLVPEKTWKLVAHQNTMDSKTGWRINLWKYINLI